MARVFGRDPMYWYRLECGLGRFSVVGTTVRRAELPEHLLADEHHQTLDGEKVYIATTVGGGCCPGGGAGRRRPGTDDLKAAYAVFKEEARDVAPKYAPKTVNTDGWKGTQGGLEGAVQAGGHPPVLLARVAQDPGPGQAPEGAVRGGLPAGLGGVPRARPPELRATAAVGCGSGRRSTSAGSSWRRSWTCASKRDRWSMAYRHPGGHRTSNMLDRLMRGMNRYFDHGQHLHGSPEACRLHCRAWALLWNFAPWHPATTRENEGWRCPAERLNRHRYHDCWLQNLLISASLGGYRCPLPQNP